ncbi:hypothetical protein ABIA85_005913 [Bradyrhizobium sp. LA6.10]|uniref:hypothetical protein n=1 Tax=Bradyrhizobium sp. LA6.10 TaxID=3156318 RepID=UPI0033910C26
MELKKRFVLSATALLLGGYSLTSSAVAQTANSPIELIRSAACANNGNVLKNGLSLVQAGAVTNEDAMLAAEAALKNCSAPAISTSAGYTPDTLNFYLTVKGAYTKGGGKFVNRFPFVLSLSEYRPAGKTYFERSYLTYGTYMFVSLETTYERYLLISKLPYGYDSRNFDRANYIRRATPTINQRDCLGYVPLWYAIYKDDFELVNDMIGAGANGALEVPYTISGPGILREFLQPYGGKPVNYLLPDLACDALSPESKVFNAYSARKMTIPLWIMALQKLQNREPSHEYKADKILKLMEGVTSVPKSLFAELLEIEKFGLNLDETVDASVFDKLIALGANINARTSKNQTLLSYFLKNSQVRPELIKMLTARGAQM